jgi:class 3 adenylate cyclase
VRAAFELLALAHWRAGRLTATVTALRDKACATLDDKDEDEDDDPSGMTELWNLAVHTTIAGDAILAVLARLVTPPADDIAAAVDRLDAATALLVNVGESAGKLRAVIGLDSGD